MVNFKNILQDVGTTFNLWPTPSLRKKYLSDYKGKSQMPDYNGKTPQQVDAEKLYSDGVKLWHG
jgi:hypothetical protein